MSGGRAGHENPGRILVVDDDEVVLRSLARLLRKRGYEVDTAGDGAEAVALIQQRRYEVMLSDIAMPNLDGIALLKVVRSHDLHVQVVLITGQPQIDTAVQALEYGAFHYLTKPVCDCDLLRVLERAVLTRRMVRAREEATETLGDSVPPAVDRAGLEATFERALRELWIAYQPIVAVSSRASVGYEALMRTREAAFPDPDSLLEAAETLGRVQEVGRAVRATAAEPFAAASGEQLLFVNVRPSDLLDPQLASPEAPLSKLARMVVLEITERTSLESIRDMRSRVTRLREMGFRIAVDDLGAGYAGLTSFAQLEPEFVKLDMSLVRDVHRTPVKQKVIRTITYLAQDMGMQVVAEGIESAAERDAATDLGCDLLQGFHFARPAAPFPPVEW